MGLHKSSGRSSLGLVLTLAVVVLWSVLPVGLKSLLDRMDGVTITWYRFVAAALFLLAVTWKRGGFAGLRASGKSARGLLLVACLCLTANYVLYILGLRHLGPSASTIVIQLAPVFLLLGGVYRESFAPRQWVGLGLLMVGLVVFFHDRLGELLTGLTEHTVGVLLILAAALVWAVYGLAQKQLLVCLSSEAILLVIFAFGSVALLPLARPATLVTLDRPYLALLVFCAINSVVAYGCFAAALAHWEASRVSAILATIPLGVVAAVTLGALVLPELVEPEPLDGLSLAGGSMVVAGSVLAALKPRV